MAICITFGTHEFSSKLEGYENVRAYCYNCGHWNGHCLTRWPFFTICFIVCMHLSIIEYNVAGSNQLQPLIPLAIHKYKEVTCYTCRFTQDLRDRPDITPDTRPPPGMPPGPMPPPQAYGGYYYAQAQAPPPQASGAAQAPPPNYGYK